MDDVSSGLRAGWAETPGAQSMSFGSILFPARVEHRDDSTPPPDCFVDLALDQIVTAVTASHDEYDLKPFFHVVPHDTRTIAYRHEVMRDLEDAHIMAVITCFCDLMKESRTRAAKTGKMRDKNQKQATFVGVVKRYCRAVRRFALELQRPAKHSQGLLAFYAYLDDYIRSPVFTALAEDVENLERDLATIRYNLLIRDGSVTVRRYENETDYTAEIESSFDKFKQGELKAYDFKFRDHDEINRVEGEVLKGVATLYPAIFKTLDDFCSRHARFVDPVVGRFDREINFYVAWLNYTRRFKDHGLSFCYPQIATGDKAIRSRDGFDLALAHKLIDAELQIVCNDFELRGPERLFVVTGPNQGGKTTFARSFGQLHWLANLGCTVPGREARLFLFDHIFTHFEKEETLSTLRGKLHDDLVRMRDILEQATPSSLVILNEIFNSTALDDAIFLSRQVLDRVIAMDALGVCVTFIEELASLAPQTVSVASTVMPDNPAERSFKILRKPANGLAYALSVAEKYGLTYARLNERLRTS